MLDRLGGGVRAAARKSVGSELGLGVRDERFHDVRVELRPGVRTQLLDRCRSDIARRYDRSVVIALNASQQATMRATSGVASPARPSG